MKVKVVLSLEYNFDSNVNTFEPDEIEEKLKEQAYDQLAYDLQAGAACANSDTFSAKIIPDNRIEYAILTKTSEDPTIRDFLENYYKYGVYTMPELIRQICKHLRRYFPPLTKSEVEYEKQANS